MHKLLLVVLSTMLSASCSLSNEQTQRAPESQKQEMASVKERAIEVEPGDCPTVPESFVRLTRKTIESAGPSEDGPSLLLYDEDAVRNAMGRRNGLTFHSDQAEVARLQSEIAAPQAGAGRMTIGEMRAAVNNLTKQLGVEVTIHSSAPRRSSVWIQEGQPIDVSSLGDEQRSQLQSAMVDVAAQLTSYPTELVKMAQLSEVVLVDLNDDTGGASIMDEGVIFVDAFDGISSWALAHELTHLWDAELCGYTEPHNSDPGFEAINPGDIYRRGKATPYVSVRDERYFSEESLFGENRSAVALGHQIEHATVTWSSLVGSSHERVEARRSIETARERVVVLENYSFTHVEEDKATIGSWLLDSRVSLRSRRNQVGRVDPIAEKVTYLAARIMQNEPAVARYLIGVNACLDLNNVNVDKLHAC